MKKLKSLVFYFVNLMFCLSILFFGLQRASAKELNIYSYRSPALLEPFTKQYEKEFNVKFNILHAKKGLAQRLKLEGKNSPADIILTVDISRLSELADMDLVKQIDSKIINNNVPKHLRDINKKWVSLSTRARIIGVSNKRVNKNDILNIEDLADPKYKGKICTRIGSHPYNRALLASIVAHSGESKATAWVEGLVSNFARKPKGNDRAQAKAIFSGECDIVLMNTYYFALMKFNNKKPEQKKWAKATDVIFYNQGGRGQHINVSGGAIAKYSKNNEEAIRFLEWMTQPKAQKIYSEVNFEYPVNPKVKLGGKIMEWGTFKADNLSISEIAKNSKKAQMIIDKVGW
jgi:iron(III) transport system substrate-binding protein